MRVKQNLDEIIYSQVVDSMLSAQWHAGEIVNLDELTRMYEVSRTPVVQAMKKMSSEGLVEILSNGRFRFPCSTPEEVRDVCAVRKMIELEAGRIICKNKNEIDFAALREMAEKCLKALDEKDYLEAAHLDRELHRTIVAGAGNDYMWNVYRLVQKKFLAINYLNRSREDIVTPLAARTHLEILDALEKYDYEAYARVSTEHIRLIRAEMADL